MFKVPVKNVIIDKEELHGIETDGILNLENLSRTMFIDLEYWNAKVEKLTRNITIKKMPDVSQACKCPLCDICYS